MGTIDNRMKLDNNNKNPITKFHNPDNKLSKMLQRQIQEVVSFYGHDTLYIKVDESSYRKMDDIFGEIEQNVYRDAYAVRFYVEAGVEFGVNHLYSSHGLVFKDEISFFISIETFDGIVGRKPAIGDIVYYIPSKRYFEVNNVNYESIFYAGHKALQYQLKCTEYVKSEKTNLQTMDVEINRISQLNDITSLHITTDESQNFKPEDIKNDPMGFFE